MRCASWMAVVGGLWLLVGQAAAIEPALGMPGCKCHSGTLCGPPCSCTPCYALVPGCCEHPIGCYDCDHVWDGFCEEKARKLACHACRACAAPTPVPPPVSCRCRPAQRLAAY